MAGQLGGLGYHGAVDVANFVAALSDKPGRFNQQRHGIRAIEFRIQVRKMRANIAQPGSAQKRVNDGVQQHICV